jgi:hypothetical protein
VGLGCDQSLAPGRAARYGVAPDGACAPQVNQIDELIRMNAFDRSCPDYTLEQLLDR